MATAKKNQTYPYSTEVYTDQLEVLDGFNAREALDYKDLEKSIKEASVINDGIATNGIHIPLLVRETDRDITDDNGKFPVFEIFDGHRRLAAISKIQAADNDIAYMMVPVRVYPASITEAEMRIIMFQTGSESRTLSPYAQAVIMRDMRDKDGLKNKEIAEKLGKTKQLVGDYLMLMDKASQTIIKQVKSGGLSATNAIEMLKAHDGDADVVDELITKTAENLEKEGKGKKITAKKIEEATGTPAKRSGAGPVTREGATDTTPVKGKHAASIEVLTDFRTTVLVQGDAVKPEAVEILDGLVDLLSGAKEHYELAPLFINMEAVAPKKKNLKEQMEEAANEETEKPAAKKAAKAKATKETKPKATAKKTAPVVEETDEDEDEDFDLGDGAGTDGADDDDFSLD